MVTLTNPIYSRNPTLNSGGQGHAENNPTVPLFDDFRIVRTQDRSSADWSNGSACWSTPVPQHGARYRFPGRRTGAPQKCRRPWTYGGTWTSLLGCHAELPRDVVAVAGRGEPLGKGIPIRWHDDGPAIGEPIEKVIEGRLVLTVEEERH